MGTTSSKPVHSRYPFETPGRNLAKKHTTGKQPLKPILKRKGDVRIQPDSDGYVPGFIPLTGPMPMRMPEPQHVAGNRVYAAGLATVPTAQSPMPTFQQPSMTHSMPGYQPAVSGYQPIAGHQPMPGYQPSVQIHAPPVQPLGQHTVQPPRRASTPYHAAQQFSDSDDESDVVVPQTQWPPRQPEEIPRQQPSAVPSQHPTPYQSFGILNRSGQNTGTQPTPVTVPRNIPPPRQATVIPELSRQRNLPAPPKNVYDESPFNALLNLPQVQSIPAPLTTTTNQQRSIPRKKSRSRGLFGFGRRNKPSPEIKYIPVYLSHSSPVASSSTAHNTTPIRFNHTLQPVAFMNHSPHRIMYQNITYPSATHLHEAFKFLEHRPDLAARIERCGIEEVYTISTSLNEFVRPDWGSVFLQIMDEVLYLKFKQHVTIRTALMSSGDLDIIYAEPGDPFWGEGNEGQGANELGKAIMRVRTRLRQEERA